MRRASLLLMISFLTLPPALRAASSLSYLTVGPMLHWNFKDRGFTAFSYGIEASWWRFDQTPIERQSWLNFPEYKLPGFGIAVGLEIDRHAVRLYTEPEVGAILVGASLGGVVEMSRGREPTRLGFQGSLWANYLVGINFRYRHIGGDYHQAIGLYTKVPFFVGGEVAYLEEE